MSDCPATAAQSLLTILDPDSAVAADKFRRLFEHLARWLEWKGCQDPDGAAAETVSRALDRLDQLTSVTESSLRAYLFGIAANVAHESGRLRAREQQLDPALWALRPAGIDEERRAIDRLTLREIRRCLADDEWRLLCAYASREDHDALCEDLGVTKGALRVKIFRIRQKVRQEIGKECPV